MERKNTILLTVIAIATLLVAVVGATFAYFTATFTPTNKENNTVNTKTKTFVNTSFDYGTAISDSNILPGHKFVKVMTVQGEGDSTAQAAKMKLTISRTDSSTALDEDIKYTLYSEDKISSSSSVTCTLDQEGNTPSITGPDGEGKYETHYSEKMTCNIPESAQPVSEQKDITLNHGESQVVNIDVNYNTKKTYYLVIEYVNKDSETQDAQGQSLEITLKAEPVLGED